MRVVENRAERFIYIMYSSCEYRIMFVHVICAEAFKWVWWADAPSGAVPLSARSLHEVMNTNGLRAAAGGGRVGRGSVTLPAV